jgi:hypothetical protein
MKSGIKLLGLFVAGASLQLLTLSAFADPVIAKVTKTEGDVRIVAAGSTEAKAATEGMSVPLGSTIKTGKDGFAVLSLMPGADAVIVSDSEVTVSELDFEKTGEKTVSRKVKLSLASGTILGNLAKGDGVSDFKISSPMGVAAARGTQWAFNFGKGSGSLQVVNGVVQLTTPSGKVISVGAGNMVAGTNGAIGAVVQMTQEQLDALIAILQKAGFKVTGGTTAGGGSGSPNPSTEPEVNVVPPVPPTPPSAEQ